MNRTVDVGFLEVIGLSMITMVSAYLFSDWVIPVASLTVLIVFSVIKSVKEDRKDKREKAQEKRNEEKHEWERKEHEFRMKKLRGGKNPNQENEDPRKLTMETMKIESLFKIKEIGCSCVST